MIIAVLQKLLPKTVFKINSPINGEICVIEQFGKRKIVVEKLTQSGPVMEEIWAKIIPVMLKSFQHPRILKQVQDDDEKIKILILGLGGGSIIKVLSKCFPKAKMTTVDYDPIMVGLGKKYLELKESENLEIIIEDASVFLQKNDELFDLIFVDLFSGETIPKKTQTKLFLRKIKEKSTKNGLIVFNRPYYQNHISEAKVFLDKLKKIFDDVNSKKILTNLIIFCKKKPSFAFRATAGLKKL